MLWKPSATLGGCPSVLERLAACVTSYYRMLWIG